MITQEKADLLTELLSDEERATKLLGLEPSEALNEINALGYDFTLGEIKEYGTLVKNAQKSNLQGEELAFNALDEVAGGIIGPVQTCFISSPGIVARPPTVW